MIAFLSTFGKKSEEVLTFTDSQVIATSCCGRSLLLIIVTPDQWRAPGADPVSFKAISNNATHNKSCNSQ